MALAAASCGAPQANRNDFYFFRKAQTNWTNQSCDYVQPMAASLRIVALRFVILETSHRPKSIKSPAFFYRPHKTATQTTELTCDFLIVRRRVCFFCSTLRLVGRPSAKWNGRNCRWCMGHPRRVWINVSSYSSRIRSPLSAERRT